MAKVEIDYRGVKRYFNDEGKPHREDGPAIIRPDGLMLWYKNGQVFNENYPSYIFEDGSKVWRKGATFCRVDGPVVNHPNGHKKWMTNGVVIWPKL